MYSLLYHIENLSFGSGKPLKLMWGENSRFTTSVPIPLHEYTPDNLVLDQNSDIVLQPNIQTLNQ